MFARPSLTNGLNRSGWKSINESNYFILQQKGQQQQNNNSKRSHVSEYRIITKRFPHFRVADHDDVNQIKEAFDVLHQEVLPEIEGKKTVKKILKQLKIWYSKNANHTFDEDVDGYATDTSITPDGNSSGGPDDHDAYPTVATPKIRISINSSSSSSSSSTKSDNVIVNEKGKAKMNEDQEPRSQSPEQLDYTVDFSDSNLDSSDGEAEVVEPNTGDPEPAGHPGADTSLPLGNYLMDLLMGWLEGPPLEGVNASSSNNKNQTILEIPMQFIDLLTYPEIDPKATKKASFAALREISFVKQRRKVLFMFTLYLIIMRLCSLDLFLVLLFVSNCGMLFLMKNSGKVNVTMAKRAVRQRIGWAKQWAGLLFKNRTSNIPSGSNSIKHRSLGAIKIAPAISTTQMSKQLSQDAIQSGSMSDTTHGGSVTTKMTPRRVGFFRNKGNQVLKDGHSERSTGNTMSAESSSIMGSSQHGSSKVSLQTSASVISSTVPSGGVIMQASLCNQTHSQSNVATDLQTTTKRRFFPKRGNSNQNTVSSPHYPAHITNSHVQHSENRSNTQPPSTLTVFTVPGSTISSGIVNNNETMSHLAQSSYNADMTSHAKNGTNEITNYGVVDTDFINFDDSSEAITLADDIKARKRTSLNLKRHRKNNSTVTIETPD